MLKGATRVTVSGDEGAAKFFRLTMKNNSLDNRPIARDKEMLRLKVFKGIRMMSLREYLDERGDA